MHGFNAIKFILVVLFLVLTTCAQANSEDLLGYWNFDNTENDVVPDLSGNRLDGALSDAVLDENGACGKAVSFNGQTGKMAVDDFPGFNGTLTLEAWLKKRTMGLPPPCLIKHVVDPEKGKIDLQCPTRLYFSVREGTEPLEIYSNSEILIGNWYHFAVTIDEEQMKMYINGNLEETAAVSGDVFTEAGALKFGTVTIPHWRAFDGLLDEVRIYNRSLSQQEIQEDMDLCHPEGYDATAHSLTGVIRGNLQEGIKVKLSGNSTDETYTDELGRFSFDNLPAGDYSLTPQYDNCSFTPPTQEFTLDRLNLNQIFFEASYTGNQSLGIKLWEFDTSSVISGSPTVSGDKVFIGSSIESGNFYCLNTNIGEKLWEYSINSTEDEFQFDVTESIVDENWAYVAGGILMEKDKGKISCLNVEDGSLIWEKHMGSIESWPAIYKSNLYVGTFSGKFHCLIGETGQEIWVYQYGTGGYSDAVEGGQAIYRNRVYFANWCGSVFCLEAETGEEIWVNKTGNWFFSCPALSKGRLYVGGETSFNSGIGKFLCLNADTGEEVWSLQTDYTLHSSPVVDGEKVYFGSFDGNVYCLNSETGQEVWEFQTEGNVWNYSEFIDEVCSLAVVKGKVYFGSWDNRIYCLNAETGEKVWSYDSGWGLSSISAAVSQGKVFFGGPDGKIFCLKAGSEDLGEWPMFHKNRYRTGSTSVISGKIIDENGKPLPQVQLSASGGAGNDFTTTSNTRGYYEFTELPEGTFTVTAYAQGYSMVSEKVTLNPLTPIDDLDFTLQPSICPVILALDSREDDINILRRFRDEVLGKTPEGQEIIKLYYQWSPVIVKAMEEDEEFKAEVTEIIDGVLPLIKGEIE